MPKPHDPRIIDRRLMYPMAVFLPCLIVVDAPVLVRRVAID
jgi:hypothetical protein